MSLACREGSLTSAGISLPCWLSSPEQAHCCDASHRWNVQGLKPLLLPQCPEKGDRTAPEYVSLCCLGEARLEHSFLSKMCWIPGPGWTSSLCPYCFSPHGFQPGVILSMSYPPGDIWQCLKMVWVVTAWKKGGLVTGT